MAAARAAGQRETLLPVSIFALLVTSNGMLTARTVPDGCPSGTCVYHPSDTKYPDMVACCTSGTSCGFFTTCVPGTELVKTPAILETQGAFTLPCGFDDIPECVTHYYPQVNASNYLCGKTAAEYTFFTTGRLTTTSSTVNILSLSLSTVDMDFVNSFSSTEYFTDDNLPTSSTVLDPTNLPSSDSHTTNKGAIAGGVVGGVAGVALLAGAGFFLLKRRRSKQGPSGGGDDANNSGAAGEHKDKNIAEAGTKGPKELDSVEAARLAEMQGTTPVGEMQGSDVREMPREMQGSDVREMAREMPDTQVKKDFAVELPADPEYSDKR